MKGNVSGMKKTIILAMAVVVIAAFSLGVWIIGNNALSEHRIGTVIQFGGYDWRVLGVQGADNNGEYN